MGVRLAAVPRAGVVAEPRLEPQRWPLRVLRPPEPGKVHPPHVCIRPADGSLVNGVRIRPGTADDFLAYIRLFVECGKSHVVHFLSADPIVIAQRDREYRDLLNRSDLNVADGMSVVWACRLLGSPGDRVAGTDGLGLVVSFGIESGFSHFLLGGTPPVLSQLAAGLQWRYPGVRFAGAIAPPFRDLRPEDLEMYADVIRKSGADALWVGLGTPKQQVVADRLRELEAAPLIFTVGAAFDFIAGVKPRAPEWMRASGLEWLHRLGTEPRRLWKRYLVGNPQFVMGMVGSWVGSKRSGETSVHVRE